LINIFGYLIQLFSPFIIGAIIALILNVLVTSLENGILKKMKTGKRGLSIVLSLVIVVTFISFVFVTIIPQFKAAGEIFLDNLPKYQENLKDVSEVFGISDKVVDNIDLDEFVGKSEITDVIKTNYKTLLNISFGLASSVVSYIFNIFIALVFAIYLLSDKENILLAFKKLFKKISKVNIYNETVKVLELSNKTFSDFIKVQVLEAFILGLLCFVGMLILQFPYAATISVIVGFTALVPLFGAFIGCIVGAFLLFMVNPIQALTFIVFFLILQQFEGNIIYPKVVGGTIGLPSILVLVAVTVGGSLGGVVGMLFGVPIVSVIYTLIKDYVNTPVRRVAKEVEK
jgi:predicted PurR-regulated permease PerM